MRDARPGAHTPRGASTFPWMSSAIARYSGHPFFPEVLYVHHVMATPTCCGHTRPAGLSPRPWSSSHNQRPRSCSSFTSRGAPWPSGSCRFPLLVHIAAKSPRLSDLSWKGFSALATLPPPPWLVAMSRSSFCSTRHSPTLFISDGWHDRVSQMGTLLKITNLFSCSSGGQKSKTEGFCFQPGPAPARVIGQTPCLLLSASSACRLPSDFLDLRLHHSNLCFQRHRVFLPVSLFLHVMLPRVSVSKVPS